MTSKLWTEVATDILVNQSPHYINIRLIDEHRTLEGMVDPINLFDGINWMALCESEEKVVQSVGKEAEEEMRQTEVIKEGGRQEIERIKLRNGEKWEIGEQEALTLERVNLSNRKVVASMNSMKMHSNRASAFREMAQLFGSSVESTA